MACARALSAALRHRLGIVLLLFIACSGIDVRGKDPAAAGEGLAPLPEAARALIHRYCRDCHDAESRKGGLDWEALSARPIGAHAAEWERALRQMRGHLMPPPGKSRPEEAELKAFVARVSSVLDEVAIARPEPGRTETLRRLNRTEYRNAIRDLLALEIDASTVLPKDDASHGFDNVTVGELSPTLLARYLTAADKISRLAVGLPPTRPGGDTFRTPPDLTQEETMEGLPQGTRGGLRIRHTLPCDGEYEIQVRLTRDRNEEVEGLREPHEMVVLVDREPVQQWTISPPGSDRNHDKVDAHLRLRRRLSAGPHDIGVTFLKNPSALLETRRQPYQAHYNMHRHPRLTPAVYQVSISGPFGGATTGDTPSRRRIFVARPRHVAEEEDAARTILTQLARRAFRRPVDAADLERPMELYRRARKEADFESGVAAGLKAILMSPEFLMRIETVPDGVRPGEVYAVGDVALASRLSFFLWSSVPDDALLDLAERGELGRPEILEREVRRMLADERSSNLASNFAGQWLHLRNLEAFTPDLRLYPDFDDNLRQAFRRETELHFERLRREDLGVLSLLQADRTFLNERLARHYGIPHVHGDRFRSVALSAGSPRGGLLRQGSVLTVTSYATRTSPVLRGHWILGNLLGTPPPPPPPNVPPLRESVISESLPMRARLAEHRANPGCAGCHTLMDPIGFPLESFDAIGGWRLAEDGRPMDTRGAWPDDTPLEGVAGLEAAIAKEPELFVGTLTEKLLTFALGRGIEPGDGPAVRRIVRQARTDGYRFSSLVVNLVNSPPFRMRRAP